MPGLRVHDHDGVRWIVFDRPAELNALRIEDLADGLEAVRSADARTSCLVLTGAGARAFSSGMHLDCFAGLDRERARALIGALAAFVGAVRRAPVPTVAAIRDHCLGAAFELALACDLRVVATDAVFGLPEIKVGIPSVIDAALLQQHVGLARAREMILTGDLYDVPSLLRSGLCNVVAGPESLEAETRRLIARVSGHSRTALAAQKRLFECWQNMGLQEAVDHSLGVFADVFAEEETRRRVDAYRAERASRAERAGDANRPGGSAMVEERAGVKPERAFRGLVGGAALAIWCGIDAEHEAEFNHWYTHQHLPERVGIPGFLRGRRYVGPDDVPCDDGGKYFTLYETEGLETLASAPYLLRLNNPTPWTRKIVPLFQRTSRSACRITASLGRGVGGSAATIEFGPRPDADQRLRGWLGQEAMPAALDRHPGLAGVHLLEADEATTGAKEQTEESRAGAGRSRAPLARWVLLVEGTSEPAVEAACRDLAMPSGLAAQGAAEDVQVRRYRLMLSLSG